MEKNNLTAIKADKTKAIVIINKDELKKKIDEFIKDNNMQLINKDPTEKYQKKIQQAIKGANSVTSVTAYVIIIFIYTSA